MEQVKEEIYQTRTEMKEGFSDVGNQITGIFDKLDCYVTKETYNKDIGELNNKLGKQSGNWDWIVKTIMAVVIGALLTLVLK